MKHPLLNAAFIMAAAAVTLAGCGSLSRADNAGRSLTAVSMAVNSASNARLVLDSVPPESLMERFEMVDGEGRIISYAAFTDTDTGALVFVDQKLYGTISHRDAQAFYTCRGHATTASSHWAQAAPDWTASLLSNSTPATYVKLDFSGKSTSQSITEVAESPLVKRVKSLIGMGTNPLSIFSSLSTAKKDMDTSNQFDKAQMELGQVTPGTSEARLSDILRPEDVTFTGDGTVISYPSHTIEFYMTDGTAKVIQQPSFYFLSKTHSTLFYAPGVRWPQCTPANWRNAFSYVPNTQENK